MHETCEVELDDLEDFLYSGAKLTVSEEEDEEEVRVAIGVVDIL